jgi:two-component system, OmpR family, KDP operon response regulator KdpE
MSGASLPSRVLIVDDEPPIRRFLRTSLTAQGYQIIDAETGAAALNMLASHRVDMVVLDLGLPDMDGLQVLTVKS